MAAFVNGKVIISGEHSVVYGKMALAASISLGVSAYVVESGGSEKNPLISKAIGVAGGNEDIQVKIESDLPIGSGLGSSAAVAAAVIKAVKESSGEEISNDELFALTMECEKLAHGNPSGIDPATVVYGGLIAYTKGLPFERLTMAKPIKLLLINSGKPSEGTKEMVELVASKPENLLIIDEIGEISKDIKRCLMDGRSIVELIDQNGRLLEKLGVVGEAATKLSQQMRSLGAAVKIVGAGGVKTGSGMMMVMAEDCAKIQEMLDNKRIQYMEIEI